MPAQQEVQVKKDKESVKLEWNAASRPFKKRSKDSYVTIVSAAALFGLILFIIDGIIPVLLVVAVVFLYYVLSTVEPENIVYKITNKGLKIGSKTYEWENMTRFWFVQRLGSEILVIETFGLPGRLEIMMDMSMKEQIKNEIEKHLEHEGAPSNFYDRAAGWVTKRLPME